MSKVVAIMSMSLDGYVADRNDGVTDVFDWYVRFGSVRPSRARVPPMPSTRSAPPNEILQVTLL